MATLQDLLEATDALLSAALGGASYQLSQDVASEAYEAYVFGLCLRAVTELGAVPILRGISAPPNPFVFRGSPGKIWASGKNFGYAVFALGPREFEIHVGVEFKGNTGMSHEVDVCIMDAADARRCRSESSRGDPPGKSLVGAWECKFLSRLQKVHGRAFVGLLADMSSRLRIKGICSNRTHDGLKSYLEPAKRPYPHFELTPLDADKEGKFVDLIKAELARIAHL